MIPAGDEKEGLPRRVKDGQLGVVRRLHLGGEAAVKMSSCHSAGDLARPAIRALGASAALFPPSCHGQDHVGSCAASLATSGAHHCRGRNGGFPAWREGSARNRLRRFGLLCHHRRRRATQDMDTRHGTRAASLRPVAGRQCLRALLVQRAVVLTVRSGSGEVHP